MRPIITNYDGYERIVQYFNASDSFCRFLSDGRATISVMGNYVKVLLPLVLNIEEYENNPYNAYTVAVSSDFRQFAQKEASLYQMLLLLVSDPSTT
ncbi:MAG: hypothetical protein R2942_00105 [Ignavibacteria bacterium]